MSAGVATRFAIIAILVTQTFAFRTKRTRARLGKGYSVVLSGHYPKIEKDKAYRPNYFKSEHCKADGTCESCEAVSGVANCLAPKEGDKWEDDMALTLSGSTWKTFGSVYDLKCPDHIANMELEVKVKADDVYMDAWSVFVNGQKLPQTKDTEIKAKFGVGVLNSGESAEIKVLFENKQNWQGEVGEVKVKVTLAELDLACPDNQVCLEKLAFVTGGRKLRTNNSVQVECLTQRRTDPACAQWRQCLGASGKEAGLTRIATASQTGRDFSRIGDELGCIDPSTSDPEGWTCNCLQAWEEACDAYGQDSDCYKASYCLSKKVCASWRSSACKGMKVKSIWRDLYDKHSERLGSSATLVHPDSIGTVVHPDALLHPDSIGTDALPDSVVTTVKPRRQVSRPSSSWLLTVLDYISRFLGQPKERSGSFLEEVDGLDEDLHSSTSVSKEVESDKDVEEPGLADDKELSLFERASSHSRNVESVDRSMSSKGCV